MISVCVVLGGVGPHFFSERLFAAVCGKPAPPLNLEEVSHTTLKAHLENVSFMSSLTATGNNRFFTCMVSFAVFKILDCLSYIFF